MERVRSIEELIKDLVRACATPPALDAQVDEVDGEQHFPDGSIVAPFQQFIEFCFPYGLLASFTLYGARGNECLAKMKILLDADEHKWVVEMSGGGIPEHLRGSFVGVGLKDDADTGADSHRKCPYMGRAVGLFVKLVELEKLRLGWVCSFRGEQAELCAKFGLALNTLVDRTAGARTEALVNSHYTEVISETAFSDEVLNKAE